MKKLSRNEMKNVVGGLLDGSPQGSGTCAVYLPPNWSGGPVSVNSDHYYQNANGSQVLTGISLSTVNSLLGAGVHWCCANCANAVWIP